MNLQKTFKNAVLSVMVLGLAFSQNTFAFFNVLMLKKSAGVNLEVPIDLADTGYDSDVNATTFESTRTSLDTTDYDGTVTYNFEIVVKSTDSSARSVNLLDSSGLVKASISVPASSALTRYRVAFTPTAGASIYRIQLPATTASADINLKAARILVDQVGATKTKLYYPLLTDNYGNSNTSDTPIDGGTGPSWWGEPTITLYWLKDNNNLATIASGNAWTFEAILASSSAGTAKVGLFQAGTTTLVTGSQLTTTSLVPTLLSASFANNATNFTDNAEFQVKTQNSAAGVDGNIYKAGIWVKLTNLTKGVVNYRVFHGVQSDTSTSTVQYRQTNRILLNTAVFSKPTVYYETVAQCSVASCASVSLYTTGTTDSGTAGATLIAGSTLNPTTSVSRIRSSALTITSGNRYFGGYTRTSGTFTPTHGCVVVTFSK